MSRAAIRVGLVGCGNVTLLQHAPALKNHPDAKVVALVDPVAARRDQVAALLDLPSELAFSSVDQMLAATELDYAVVTVPPAFRRPIIEGCARHGVHVLAEKPIATIPSEAASMRDTMARADLQFGMVHNYLYFPEYRLLRRMIEEGAIGQVRHIALNFLGVPDKPGNPDYRPAWRHDPLESGGGVLMDMIHALYLAEYLIGHPARSVMAAVDNQGYPEGQVEDLALLTLAFDGSYAQIQMAWGVGPGGVAVTGTTGRLLIFYENYGTGPFAPVQEFLRIGQNGQQWTAPATEFERASTFRPLHENFMQAIQGTAELAAPAADGQRALEAALGAYASGLQGSTVALPLPEDNPVFLHGLRGLAQLPVSEDSPLWRRALFGIRSPNVDRLP